MARSILKELTMKILGNLATVIILLALATSCDFGPDMDLPIIEESETESETDETITEKECIPHALKEKPPAEIIEFVEQQREYWIESLVSMSIRTREDLEHATIRAPFRDIALDRDALSSGITELDQLFIIYDAWIFPILIDGKAVAVARGSFFEEEWIISSVGSPILAQALNRIGSVIDQENSIYTRALVSDFTHIKLSVIATPQNDRCLVYPTLILPIEFDGIHLGPCRNTVEC